MPDSLRLQIQKALCTQLETITSANGYGFDMAGKVFRGRVIADAEDLKSLPIISVLEAPREGGVDYPEHGNVAAFEWELYVSAWLKLDPQNPTDACHALLADVKRCLAALRRNVPPHQHSQYPELMLGGLITKLEMSGGLCRPPDERSYGTSYFLLPIKVHFTEDTEQTE
ncbi:MAG: hypothetical protein JKX92_06095 [Porticoccaceae bacterium]|nr:hypothetical protein [Porticoccaceae bacterium]